MIRLLLITNLILAPLAAAMAETVLPLPEQSKPDRAKPVPMAPAKPHKVPALEESALKSGLKLALMEIKRLPLVSLQIVLPFAGSNSDPAGKSGLAKLTAGLLTEGTQKRNGVEFTEALEDIGAQISVNILEEDRWGTTLWWKDALVVSVFALKEKLEPALALAAEMINIPSFPEPELARAKQETLEELRQQKNSPEQLTHRRLEKKVFGNHTYGRQADETSVNSITREDITTAHEKNFTPSIIAASGDISMEELKGLAEKYFPGKEVLNAMPAQSVPVAAAANSSRGTLSIEIIDQPGSIQSTIAGGRLSIPRNHPDYIPAVVMNGILGAIQGRIEKNIREKNSWAYFARSFVISLKDSGMFAVKTSVQVDKTADAVTEILGEIRRIQEEPVSAEELAQAQHLLAGFFVLGTQKVQSISENIARIELNDMPKDFIATYRDKIMAVTVEDVRRVARTYLNADDMQFVIAGDCAKIHKVLSAIAPVTVYDADGNPKPAM